MAFDWKKTIGAFAPGLAAMAGGLVGGPVGAPLAGIAVKSILGHFGIEPTGDPEKDEALAADSIQNMTPADAIALKKVDAEVTKTMAEAGVDVFALEVEDRKSAREMRIKLGGDNISAIIALLVVGAWGLVQYLLFTATAALPNEALLLRGMGTLDAALLAVLYFFFGGAKSEQDKSRMDAGDPK